MPTVLGLAGARYPETDDRRLEGQDILPMIKGRPGRAERTFCWEHEGNRAIRRGNWKLVTLADSPGGWELYDLSTDRPESNNLAAARPEVVKELSAEYDRWADR